MKYLITLLLTVYLTGCANYSQDSELPSDATMACENIKTTADPRYEECENNKKISDPDTLD